MRLINSGETVFLKDRDLQVLKACGITITEILGQGAVIKGNESNGYTIENGRGIKARVNVAVDSPVYDGDSYAVQD